MTDVAPTRDPYLDGAVCAAELAYSRLVLITGSGHRGKSQRLAQLKSDSFSVVNLGTELSRRLLKIPADLRASQAEDSVARIIEGAGTKWVGLDNTEILFEAQLSLNPLELLKALSRFRLLVATWNGDYLDDCLFFGARTHPSHREYRPIDLRDIQIIQQAP